MSDEPEQSAARREPYPSVPSDREEAGPARSRDEPPPEGRPLGHPSGLVGSSRWPCSWARWAFVALVVGIVTMLTAL
jgi:hypothetical protein